MHPESWMPRFKWDLIPFPCRLQLLAASTLWSDFQALPCSGIERGTFLCSSVLVSISEPLVWAASLVFVQVLSWFGKTQLRSHLCSLSALWWHLWLWVQQAHWCVPLSEARMPCVPPHCQHSALSCSSSTGWSCHHGNSGATSRQHLPTMGSVGWSSQDGNQNFYSPSRAG